MDHYYDQYEAYYAELREREKPRLEKEKQERVVFRKKVVDYIHHDLQKRSLDTILADILLDPEGYKTKIKHQKE